MLIVAMDVVNCRSCRPRTAIPVYARKSTDTWERRAVAVITRVITSVNRVLLDVRTAHVKRQTTVRCIHAINRIKIQAASRNFAQVGEVRRNRNDVVGYWITNHCTALHAIDDAVAVNERLEAERTNLVLPFNVVPVHAHVEVASRFKHCADRRALGRFGLEVRVTSVDTRNVHTVLIGDRIINLREERCDRRRNFRQRWCTEAFAPVSAHHELRDRLPFQTDFRHSRAAVVAVVVGTHRQLSFKCFEDRKASFSEDRKTVTTSVRCRDALTKDQTLLSDQRWHIVEVLGAVLSTHGETDRAAWKLTEFGGHTCVDELQLGRRFAVEVRANRITNCLAIER